MNSLFRNRDNSAPREHFYQVIEQLQSWNAPERAIQLAQLAMRQSSDLDREDLSWAERQGIDFDKLWESYARWQLVNELPHPNTPTADLSQELSLKLRILFRAAYLDLDLVIFVIAEHAVSLNKLKGWASGGRTSFWRETETVFFPLLTMLGMWHLRRQWVELVASRLYPVEYHEIERRLKASQATVERHQTHLHTLLRQLAPSTIPFEILPQDLRAGRIIYRMQQGESIEELIATVTVKIKTHSSADCYRLLAILHQLGRPISGSLSDRIGAPYANGYRALHTAIVGSAEYPEINNVQFVARLVSEEMDQINEYGIIAGPEATSLPYPQAWWNRQPQEPETRQLLQGREIGDHSQEGEQIYVFTPKGDIKRLRYGSTAIDFAYELHSYIGHHCRGVEINGQKALHSQRLQNGDLIELNYDRKFFGPDPSWLEFAYSKKTQTLIKKALSVQHQMTHPGRRTVERYLDALKQETGFTIPKPQLETYYDEATRQMGLESRLELFEAICPQTSTRGKKKVSINRLLSFILEAELSASVVDQNGQEILFQPNPLIFRPLLRFCSTCKPVHGTKIMLHSREVSGYLVHTLHRDPGEPASEQATRKRGPKLFGIPDSPGKTCLRTIQDHSELNRAVQWRYVALERRTGMVTLYGRDRNKLLGDILEPIYQNDRVDLKSLRGNVDQMGMVDTYLTVEFDTLDQVDTLLTQYRAIDAIEHVIYWPVEGFRPQYRRLKRSVNYPNPYSTGGPVQEWEMFFGRRKEVDALLDFMQYNEACSLCILHGHRRSGKTSLAQQALKQIPLDPEDERHSLAVYVDLGLLASTITSHHFYHLIAKELRDKACRTLGLCKERNIPLPSLETFSAAPFPVFQHFITGLSGLIAPRKFLIVLDEFNIFVANAPKVRAIFAELRHTIISQNIACDWLLITHTRHFQFLDPFHPARNLFELSEAIELPLLDINDTCRLIEDPVKGTLSYHQDVVSELARRSSGQPYIINLICYELVQEVGYDGRTFVTMDDLRKAASKILQHGTTHFNFAIEAITGSTRPAVAAIARANSVGQGLTLSEAARHVATQEPDAQAQLKELIHKGIIHEQPGVGGKSWLHIRVDYFREWVEMNWS